MILACCCTKQMKTFSIDKIMTTESENSKVHLWHRSGPLEAREDITQCEATV